MAMKRFVLPVIILTLCLFLTSCGNLFQKTLPGITPAPETTDTAATSNGSGTVTFTGRIGISGAFPKEIADTFTRKGTSGNATRTAFPSAPTETAYYVEVKDTSVTPNTVVDSINSPALFNIDQDTGVFSLPLELNHAYTITVSIIKNNDSSKPLLSDSVSNVKLTVTAPVYIHDFTLNPVTDSGTGNVSLPLSIMAGPEPAITKITDLKTGEAISSDTLTFTAGETTGSGNNAITAYTLAASDIPAGVYAVSFEVFSRLSEIANQQAQTPAVSPYNDSEEYRVGTMRAFFTTQTINVYKNMTTDTWVNNGNLPIDQNGAFSVDSTTSMKNIQTVFYVDSHIKRSGNGTYDKPFKTLNEAMFCITGGSNSGKPVYIHIKDGYQETFSSTYPKRVSGTTYAFVDNVTLEIECWKNTVGDGKGTATILTSGSSVSPIFGLSTNKTDTGPTVTLRGLTLSGSGATNATGIELVNGNLTLENCQITGFQTAGINVSGGSLTVSGYTYITGNGTSGAISNVKLAAGKKISVGALTSNSKIGVTLADEETEAGTVFTTGFRANNASLLPSSIFTSDKTDADNNALPVGYGSADDAARKEAALYTPDHGTITPDIGDGIRIQLDKYATAVNGNKANRTITISVIDIAGNRITPDSIDAHLLLAGDEVPSSTAFEAHSGNTFTISPSLKNGSYQFYVTAEYDGTSYSATFDFTVHNGATVPLATLTAPPTSGSYSLSSKEELTKIFEWATDTNIQSNFEDVTFDISKDIDITDFGGDWHPITTFKGTINGNGHTVSIPFSSNGGLVGTNNGVIENLVIDITGDIEANTNYNFFAYTNTGIIRNCKTTGSVKVKTQYDIGPFAVINEGLIENCINEADLTYNKMNNWGGIYGAAAGIAAHNNPNGIISNCVNYGTIYAATTYYVHSSTYNGRVGSIFISSKENSTVQNCYWLKNCAKYYNISKSTDINFNRIGTFGQLFNTGGNSFNVDEVAGTNIGCGYFEGRTITAGTAEECETDQTLAYGTDLLDALNAYVDAHPENNLKHWIMGTDGHVTLEGLEE